MNWSLLTSVVVGVLAIMTILTVAPHYRDKDKSIKKYSVEMLHNFIAILKAWLRVLTKPNTQSFVLLRNSSAATLSNALILVLLAGVTFAVLKISSGFLYRFMNMGPSTTPPYTQPAFLKGILHILAPLNFHLYYFLLDISELYARLWAHTGLSFLFRNLVLQIDRYFFQLPRRTLALLEGFLSPVKFLILLAVYYRVAISLGGRGEFGRFAFLVAAISAVTTIMYAALLSLPFITGIVVGHLSGPPSLLGHDAFWFSRDVTLFVLIPLRTAYWFFLLYFAMRVEHGLTWRRAIAGVVLSFLLFFVVETFYPHGITIGMFKASQYAPLSTSVAILALTILAIIFVVGVINAAHQIKKRRRSR